MKKGTLHQVPQVRKPPTPVTMKAAIQMMVSRIAGSSERCISSLSRFRGIGV